MNLTFIFDALRLAFKSLSDRKLRSILTIVGIAIGPLALVMMSSVVKGHSDYVIKQLESLGQNLIIVRPQEHFKLAEKDLDTIRNIPGVKRAEPYYMTQATVKVGTKEKNIIVYAVPVDLIFEAMSNLKILEGKAPSTSEIVRAVIGYNIAFDEDGNQVHFLGDSITITLYKVEAGGKIRIKRVTVLISAILDKFGGAFFLSPDETIFLSPDAGPKLLGLNEWSGILVLAENSQIVLDVEKAIKEKYHDSISVISFQGIANVVSSITGAMNFITFSTSLCAFAVAVAGVAATMITSVIERIREIGVMKAIGFTDSQVLFMILSESLVMSLTGGSIGITLGIIGAYILASKGFVIRAGLSQIVIQAPPAITPELLLETIAITLLVGILGGVFPAYKAAKIPPAVALRYE